MLSVLVSIAGAVQPDALAVYDKVYPLFEIGGEKVLDSWGQPLFVEHGIPYWRWEDGVVCCAVRDGQPMLAAYSEIVDSFKGCLSSYIPQQSHTEKPFQHKTFPLMCGIVYPC